MVAFAYISDLQLSWRTLSTEETISASFKIEQASRMIVNLCRRNGWPSVESRLADGTLSAEDVSDVVLAMVQRAMTNPDGVESRSETAGPLGQTVRYVSNAGGLYLEPEERATLTPDATYRSNGRAFAVDLWQPLT